jgi:hypothetical protein
LLLDYELRLSDEGRGINSDAKTWATRTLVASLFYALPREGQEFPSVPPLIIDKL